jgi:glycosyltransferase involved in cell wall biosynthesis
MTDIAIIILTFNEELNLPATLDSIKGWAREIFIVDSFSSDRTVDVALAHSHEKVFIVQHAFEDYSKQWNWALTHLPISSAWTLKLDADERVTEEFKNEVDNLTKNASTEIEGIFFRRKILFMGRMLHWGGITENYDLRMWRTGCATFEDRAVNEHAIVRGGTTKLKSYVLHANTKSIADWLDKHNRYSSLEAISLINGKMTGDIQPRFFGDPAQQRMLLRKIYYGIPLRASAHFIYRFILRGGFLDGRYGFWYAFLTTVYLYWIGLKVHEYKMTGILPGIIWPQRGLPHPALGGAYASVSQSNNDQESKEI